MSGPESVTVTLASGGTVTLTIDVEWLKLSPADFAWLLSVVEMLHDYEGQRSARVAPPTPRAVELPPSATPKPVGRANGTRLSPSSSSAPTRRTGRRLKLSDDTLAQIADVANQAIRDCRDPGKALAERFGIKPVSASVYMIEARNAGHDIPHQRACVHCGRTFHLRGVTTHERTCLERPLPVKPVPVVEPAPASVSLTALIDENARHVAKEKQAGRKLADEIAELRARDRAENDAKGRSAITDNGDEDETARICWTCADCGTRFDRKMDLHCHLADEHDRHVLHAHEEVGAIA